MGRTDFARTISLDNDCFVLRNIDHLAWATPTPAATCQPRRHFQKCTFNSGVHVLTPSAEHAARLLGSYTTRGPVQSNGGEQEVWANFETHAKVHELPVGYNAHQGLAMSDDEWRRVSIVHSISGHTVNRLPAFLKQKVHMFESSDFVG